ncbi:hypothetical protein N0Y54_10500 [Nostoc punctiforme UO1]
MAIYNSPSNGDRMVRIISAIAFVCNKPLTSLLFHSLQNQNVFGSYW